jgi:DNA invertase Pin-like site-specific DNA recombinase
MSHPKVTPQQRDDIRRRRADGEKARDLALEYGVSVGTIYAYS